ncbi:glycoside hydrolase family 9 protein, partial [Hamadaea sp. NPDC050747]|uniref:glycoside hydrolase family 9 protein n=1 Tax=Hamadaea sp. NPDC050747 TaxID=3155789 RepID=UPI0033C9B3EF
GGSYSDNDVSDKFYWAAAELYLTTGAAAYLADVTASRHHTGGAGRHCVPNEAQGLPS